MTGSPIDKPHNQTRIGIQLYSLGLQFAEDAPGVLRTLAKQGYQGVEFAWAFGGLSPASLRDLLQELNLQTVSIYVKADQLLDEDNEIWTYANILGCRYLTMGRQDRVSERAWPQAIRDIETLGRRVADRCHRLLYHNHCDELKPLGNSTALDQLFEKVDPHWVGAELDVAYFVQVGLDPVAYIRRYGHRMPLLHARDTTADGCSVPVGAGVVDFPAIIDAARDTGTEWLVVEQNPSPDAVNIAQQSITALRAIRDTRQTLP